MLLKSKWGFKQFLMLCYFCSSYLLALSVHEKTRVNYGKSAHFVDHALDLFEPQIAFLFIPGQTDPYFTSGPGPWIRPVSPRRRRKREARSDKDDAEVRACA